MIASTCTKRLDMRPRGRRAVHHRRPPALAALRLEQLSVQSCAGIRSGNDVLAALAAALGACGAMQRLELEMPVTAAGLEVVLDRLPHAVVLCSCMQYRKKYCNDLRLA